MLVVLIPAYNEAGSIGATIESVLAQTRPADRIVVIPNGCTDDTADIARQYPVTVMELPRLAHRKSEALNRAWHAYAQHADLVVGIDADTLLAPTALAEWEEEMAADMTLAGSSARYTMLGDKWITRLQKAEYATGVDNALRRGWTSVLPGAGCVFRGCVLQEVARRDDREGPWSYRSQTEDYELTYRIRELGYRCHVSPLVRSFTDSMQDLRSLWHQRIKWQIGTAEDLLVFGINRTSLHDWAQQGLGALNAFVKLLWLVVLVWALTLESLTFVWFWWLVPFLFLALSLKRAYRIPYRDRRDMILAWSFFPNELYSWMGAGWFVRAWADVLVSKFTKKTTDGWAAQYAAEGV